MGDLATGHMSLSLGNAWASWSARGSREAQLPPETTSTHCGRCGGPAFLSGAELGDCAGILVQPGEKPPQACGEALVKPLWQAVPGFKAGMRQVHPHGVGRGAQGVAPGSWPFLGAFLPQTHLPPESGRSVTWESLTAPHNLFFLFLHLWATLEERNGCVQNCRQFRTNFIYFEGIQNFFLF